MNNLDQLECWDLNTHDTTPNWELFIDLGKSYPKTTLLWKIHDNNQSPVVLWVENNKFMLISLQSNTTRKGSLSTPDNLKSTFNNFLKSQNETKEHT